ncbi:hypothetical protein T492DRAFT_1000187 [Pavlovales sp. CCMP2436]|nr:hypothetical protein T492DRAFT_1000187 [Pavlovales sp. CCMP2436]
MSKRSRGAHDEDGAVDSSHRAQSAPTQPRTTRNAATNQNAAIAGLLEMALPGRLLPGGIGAFVDSEYCLLVGDAGGADSDDPQADESGFEHEEPDAVEKPFRKRPFICTEPGCEYAATRAPYLKAHMRTHNGDRPYACDQPDCSYRAAMARKLEEHKRTHTMERPFPCVEPGCTYKATQAGTLKRHQRTCAFGGYPQEEEE